MDVRTLAVALVAGLNALVEKLEEAISADGDGEEQEEKPARRSRSSRKDEEEEPEEKPARRSRSKKDEEEDDTEDDKDDDDKDGDAPSEDDIVDAVRAAQKVLEKDDVVAIIRKYGKKDRASQVPEDRRQAVIDALDKAVDEAK